jgi:hypothetical protein
MLATTGKYPNMCEVFWEKAWQEIVSLVL